MNSNYTVVYGSCTNSHWVTKNCLKKYYVTTWCFEGTPVAFSFVVKPFSLLAFTLSAKKGKEKQEHGEVVHIEMLPPPQAFPQLSEDWGTREHARSAKER